MYQETLVDILKDKKNLREIGVSFIEGSEREDFLSYQELYNSAIGVLSFLQSSGIKPKHELVFQIEDNKTFIIVFWACILGGIIPVPVAIGRNDDHKQKLFNIWPVLNNPWLIVSSKHLSMLEAFAQKEELSSILDNFKRRWVALDGIFSSKSIGDIYPSKADDIAFIQFSSGSTGSPKGVSLTHKNLITNMAAIARGGAYTSKDSLISWMPLTHDMGLIGFHLNPLVCGIQHYIIPTSLFVRRPSIWLDKTSEYKVSVLCSPNFGYHYVLKHCLDSIEINWDLTHVRLIYNGAEPISEELCQEFLTKMLPYGLKNTAMCPVYGLAEASLAVSISDLDEPVSSVHLDREKLGFGDKISEPLDLNNTVSFVNVGREVSHCSIRITDRDHKALDDNTIGHVEIKGNNVTAGYYNNKEATRKVITEDGWLNTGDLGFLRKGELFITGRDKDIIFVNGQNYYPHDIERVGEELPEIELNKIAVAGYFNHDIGQDELVSFIFHRGDLQKFIPIAFALKKHINEQFGLSMDRAIPVKVIPKTTSGKIQRFKLLEDFKAGAFTEAEEALDLLLNTVSPTELLIVPPSTNDEQKMLQIWGKLLQSSPISVEDKFFEIGGNSLKAAELGMRLQKEFQVELSLDVLYENQTIRELAGILQDLENTVYKSIPKVLEKRWHNISVAQKGIFYQWELNKSSLSYNMPLALQINGPLNTEKVKAAFREIVNRHESLRMNFRLRETPQFTVHKKVKAEVEELSSSLLVIHELLSSLVQPFDLREGPLFRCKLIKLKHEKHILFLDIHHIISDGVSVSKLLNELWTAYAGKELPEVAHTYKDYVPWENKRLESGACNSHQEYWKTQLEGTLPVLSLPTDFPRPAIFEDKGAKLNVRLGESQTRQLQNFANAHNCSLHVLMFAFYHILLSKYSGQEELIIGIPVSGRPHADLQDMQGMFVNNLPIRTKREANSNFLEELAQINKKVKEALNYQDYPFGKIVEDIDLRRDVSRNPVFDTMFVFQNMGLPHPLNPELYNFRYFFDPGFSKYDISMEVFEEGDSLEYAIEYASSLFSKETIARIARYFENIIAKVLQNPKQLVAEISLLSEEEYKEQIGTFNETEAPFPAKKIHQLFEEQVAKTPQKIALSFQGESYTYEVLNEKANRQASILKKNGLQPGRAVTILLDRSLELVVSILAVLKSGACYVPIDPELPQKRIKFMVNDSHSDIIITEKKHISLVHQTSWEQNEVDYSLVYIKKNGFSQTQTSVLKSGDEGDQIAYIIYTSGTTGNPKGVMISHTSLVNYITWSAKVYCKDDQANFPLFSSVSFDLTITSIFTPLITGNTLVIYGQQEQELLLNQVISDNKVDIIKLTPSHLRLLCQQEPTSINNESRVKRLIVGGEQLTAQLAGNTYRLFDEKIEILNEYGPTEATVGCMIHAFEEDDISAAVPIGVPAQNTQLYVLDKELNPVPVGVEGELYISGEGLAIGYINQEELTDQKFVKNPFIKGARMYKTGDIVRRNPEGVLVYIGRRDKQVKIDGYRIELAEIEHHIKNHEQVLDTVVVPVKNKSEKTYLKAYFQPNPTTGTQLKEVGLKDFLAEKLPHYMIPVEMLSVEKMPLTQNGKIDLIALANLENKTIIREDRLPDSLVEAISIEIWEKVLGESSISVKDNFFALGGDSIKAVQIASRLYEVGIEIQVKDILTYHTIERISKHAHEINGTRTYEQDIIEGDVHAWPIISWFFGQGLETPGFYNQSILLSLNNNVDVGILDRAFGELIKHHDGLRINYEAEKQTLFYNHAHVSNPVRFKRFGKEGSKDLSEIYQEMKAGFDLASSLLIQGAIITEKETPIQLFLTAHHLVVDGISWRILLEDLLTVYLTLEQGKEVKLPQKTGSLQDWGKEINTYAKGEEIKAEQTYWEEIKNTDFSIPVDMVTPNWQTTNLKKLSKTLSKDKTSFLLKEAQSTHKTDILLIQLTALAQTLTGWTDLSTCVIELENHGRHLTGVDTSRTIGWFTTMHPLKISMESDELDEQIKGVKRHIQEIPNNGMGYGLNKYRINSYPTGKEERAEVRFNYLGQFGQELSNQVFTFEQQDHGGETAPNNLISAKLEFNTMVINGQLQVELNYNRLAFHESTIQGIIEQFFQCLDTLISHIRHDASIYLTPADFEDLNLNQEELDALFN